MQTRILLQVTAPAIAIAVLMIGVSAGSAWSIHRLQTNLTSILAESVTSVKASGDLQNSLRRLRYRSLLYLIHPTPDILAEIADAERDFHEAFEQAREACTTPQEEACLDRIETGFSAYLEEMARLRTEAVKSGPPKDFATVALTHPIRHIVEPCQELGDLNREQLEQTVRDSNDLSGRWSGVLLFLGIASPLGGLIAGYGIARGLTRSIARLRVRVRDVFNRLSISDSQEDVRLTLVADGDLAATEKQLEEVVRRVETVMERLQRQQREILRAEQLAAVGQLAAGVAHEVRNPLTGMKLLVEAALRPQRPHPLSREDLEVIHAEIVRLEEIVRYFLDFARPQPLQRATQDLRDVVVRPVELVRGRARHQRVELEVTLPDRPVIASIDAAQIHTVVVNLLLNALDAMPNGGRIQLSIDSQDGTARIVVRDTGSGIAPEVLPILFTPFTSTKPTGTGLGLSVSRRVVEEHGGTIRAENAAEGGARFVIGVPVV